MSRPVILFYSPAPAPYAPKLLQLCAMQGIKLRVVDGTALNRTVGALARGLSPAEEHMAENSPPLSPVDEPILIFCSLTNAQLDRLLAALRRMELPPSVLKAVLTPHNAGWTLSALYEELCRERQSMSSPRGDEGKK